MTVTFNVTAPTSTDGSGKALFIAGGTLGPRAGADRTEDNGAKSSPRVRFTWAAATALASETYRPRRSQRIFLSQFRLRMLVQNVDVMSVGKVGSKPLPSYFCAVTDYKIMQDNKSQLLDID
jgi:hypothetical protein